MFHVPELSRNRTHPLLGTRDIPRGAHPVMQVVSKWKVIVNIPWTHGTSPDREFCFWIYDNHGANVLRKSEIFNLRKRDFNKSPGFRFYWSKCLPPVRVR